MDYGYDVLNHSSILEQATYAMCANKDKIELKEDIFVFTLDRTSH